MKLYPYQQVGADFLATRDRAVLADEMGLGKTIQAITAAKRIGARRLLVICPAILKVHWQRELEAAGYPAGLAYGETIPGERCVILNYELVTRNEDILSLMDWDVVICDEAHRLKNKNAKVTRAFWRMQQSGWRAWFLTGTPMMNRPIELYTMYRFCGGRRYNEHTWGQRYCHARRRQVKRGKWEWDYSGASNLGELREMLRHFLLRREKRDVLRDLPEITHTLIPVEAGNAWAVVEKKFGRRDYFDVVDSLRGEARKMAKEKYARAAHETALGKVQHAVFFAVDSLANGPLLVFCWHQDVADAVANGIRKATKADCAVITGKTPIPERQGYVDDFRAGRLRCIVCNMMAMGEGLTLTAASVALFAEQSFVPSRIAQAAARIHRIGQTAPVNVYHLVAEGTLDVVQAQSCLRKMRVFSRTIPVMKAGA